MGYSAATDRLRNPGQMGFLRCKMENNNGDLHLMGLLWKTS